jgi:tRNA A-37 threonylcarbamoyl transferase component Bud32
VLGDLLGRGGMAEVFAGHAVGDHGFQKPVAIKRLLAELANDEVFVDRLIEEAKLLVGMQHGNIVSVLDLAREGDDVFLVMEFVDGPSLRQLIKARKTLGLSLGVATYIVQSAAAGLEFAHARPGGAIIHADVSPSNLLLTTSGEVRVADFGIARREGLGHGIVEGKWAYMAPEQARGEPLAPRSDVFALGVVLYELLTGRHPFGAAVTADERDDRMRVIPPRQIKPGVPHGIESICMRALAHDPRDRYGRMQQLIDALVEERFANGYREGASDLAQAIREGGPGAGELGAPRTMHTDRPLTLMTRSLLRDVTPVRRPQHRPTPRDRMIEAPPADAFPAEPGPGDQTVALVPDESPSTQTVARAIDDRGLPAGGSAAEGRRGLIDSRLDHVAPPQIPSSGAYTVVRDVDAWAQAILEVPPQLRADGTPMPPFRLPSSAVPGDELASVVGGHTLTGHAAGIAVDGQPRRWTLFVLAAAALIGVIAAIVIQLRPERPVLTELQDREAEVAVLASPPPAPAKPAVTPIETPPPPVIAQPTVEPDPPAADPAEPAAEVEPTAKTPRHGSTKPPARVKTPEAEKGVVSVQSSPWSWVTIGNQRKETPDRFYLPPGTHVAKFYSPDTGVTKLEPITIEAGEVVTLNVPMDR